MTSVLLITLIACGSLAQAETIEGSYADKAQVHQAQANIGSQLKRKGLPWLDKLMLKEMGGGFSLQMEGAHPPSRKESAQIKIGDRTITHHKELLRDIFHIKGPTKDLTIDLSSRSLTVQTIDARRAKTENLYYGKDLGLLGKLGALSHIELLKTNARGKEKQRSSYGLRLKSGKRIWMPKAIGRRLQSRTSGK